MLPSVKTLKTSAIASVLAISLAIPAAPAFAWGQREQDVLKGVIGTVIIGALINEAVKPKPRTVYTGTKSYATPSYTYAKPQHGNSHVYYSVAASAFNSYSYSQRKEIQRDLKRLGYYGGAIDGTFGERTFRATVAFARSGGHLNKLATRNGAFAIYDILT